MTGRAVRRREGGRLWPRRDRMRSGRGRRRRNVAGGCDRRRGGGPARATVSAERMLVMGALTRGELEVALEADADVVAWREGFARAAAALAVQRPAGAGAREAGHRHGPARDAAIPARRAASRRWRPADTLELAGLMTHFATADEPDPTSSSSSCVASGRSWRVRRAVSRLRRARGQQRRGAARRTRVALRHGALRHRGLRHGPVRQDPLAREPRAGARRCARTWRT